MAIKTSANRKQAATVYKNNKTWEKNRIRRLKRALKKNPENQQIELALKGVIYRRKTPKNQVWSKQKIAIAKVYKEFTGKFNPDIFSNNEKVALPALMTAGPKSAHTTQKTSEYQMFQLGTRARELFAGNS